MNEPDLRQRVSAICLGLPEAVADDTHPPHRRFRAGARSFAYYAVNEHGEGRIALIVRAEPGVSSWLVAVDAERFALPRYAARSGWASYHLDLSTRAPDWEEVEASVLDSYRIQAPARLRRQMLGQGHA